MGTIEQNSVVNEILYSKEKKIYYDNIKVYTSPNNEKLYL